MSGDLKLDEIVVSLSAGSPRNIIRICKAIFDQQSEMAELNGRISHTAIFKGIELIAAELAKEALPPNVLQDLRKLKHTDFTVRDVYADVFKITQPAGLTKVQTWQDSGAVSKIGSRQENRANRPSYVYGVSSPIVLKYIFSDISVLDFFAKKVRFCPSCKEIALRDWDQKSAHSCHVCQTAIPGEWPIHRH